MAEEQENSEAQVEEKQEKKGKFKLLLISLIVIMLAAGGYGIYVWKFASHQGAKEAKKVEKEGVGAMFSLEPFIFNLSGDHSRFVKLSLTIEMKDQKVLDEAKQMLPALRDRALSFLSSQPLETFMDVQKREGMKKEIKEKLKLLFKEGNNIKQIYITDIIVQ